MLVPLARSRNLPLLLGAGVTAAALLAALGGCSTMNLVDRSASHSAPAAADAPLSVTTANGAIEVTRTDAPDVRINAVIRARTAERAAAAAIVARRAADGTLEISIAWPDNRREGNEGASFTITAPGASAVRLDTSNGAVHLSGLSGPAELDTSNGPITVVGHAGDVNAQTSNGSIQLDDVIGAADASTSNGNVELIDITGHAFAETSNGSITIQLARKCPGPFIADTSNGNVHVLLGPDFRGEVKADTSNGSASYNVPHAVAGARSRDSFTFRVGEGGAASRISTSNGSVQVDYVPGLAPTITPGASAALGLPSASARAH